MSKTILKLDSVEVTQSDKGTISFETNDKSDAMFDLFEKITQLEQEVKELKATQNALALKLKLLRESAIGEDTGEIYLDLTQESEQIALYDDISAPLKQLAQHDKEVTINAIKEFVNCITFDNNDICLEGTYYIDGQGADTLNEFTVLFIEQLQQGEE